jgi:hypothetical protein
MIITAGRWYSVSPGQPDPANGKPMMATGDTVQRGVEVYAAFYEPTEHLTHWIPPTRVQPAEQPR